MQPHRYAGTLLVLAAVAGCSAAPPSPRSSAVPAPSAEVRNLVLPLDRYELSPSDTQVIESAEDVIVRRCMAAQGFSWPLLPRSGDTEPVNRRRYGVVELSVARRFGYHLPPDAPQTAHRRALAETREDALRPAGKRAAYSEQGRGGCWNKAHAQLLENVPTSNHDLLNRVVVASFDTARHDKAVVRTVSAWSACMRRSGHPYADPLAAAGDGRWARSARPTAEELRTAVADVRCKQKTLLVRVWAHAEERAQRTAVHKHRKDFNALMRTKTSWLASAHEVLDS
ncbi:hypothetical protein ACFU96_27910 [Streptomyces sp. NPDC057620]|uniref:hypothetical protein n=1 Tax=Streptomyces sp. NPDC057620 TaxID=3346185 RepID=UPI0036BB80A9